MEGKSTVSDSILGDKRHLFLLTLYNSINIGGHVSSRPPCSAVPDCTENHCNYKCRLNKGYALKRGPLYRGSTLLHCIVLYRIAHCIVYVGQRLVIPE